MPETAAERANAAAEHMLETFRDRTVLGFVVMCEGLPKERAKQMRKKLEFFETESTPELWAWMTANMPDIAASMLADWQRTDDWSQRRAS